MEDTILQNYMNQLRNYPLLTAEQELELAELIRKGDINARQKLINANLRLVVSIAKKYVNSSVSIMDIIQEGNLGLITAAQRYRASFKTRFSTYAYLWISQSIVRFVRNKAPMINIPYRKEFAVRKIEAVKDYLYRQQGSMPSVEEIACYLGSSVEEVNASLKYSLSVSSLDFVTDSSNDKTICEFITDDNIVSPEDILIDKEQTVLLKNMLDKLSSKEKEVLINRYNLNQSRENTTLRSIAEDMSISTECVRQIEKRAIKKLRNLENAI